MHPQSIVHSLVEYVDGSVLAQLAAPDMRTPIAHALAWPERIDSGVEFLDLLKAGRLDFRAPDLEKFRCLALAQAAARAGGLHPVRAQRRQRGRGAGVPGAPIELSRHCRGH